jgi:hypothetical protein
LAGGGGGLAVGGGNETWLRGEETAWYGKGVLSSETRTVLGSRGKGVLYFRWMELGRALLQSDGRGVVWGGEA